MNENRFGSPTWITDALQAHFGEFNVDLAAEPWSAVVGRYITEQQDVFKVRPRCAHGFMNPPYGPGQLERFVSFARDSVVEKRIDALTLLVPHYTAEGWWRHVEKPEGRALGAAWNYGHINHPRLKEWTRLRSSRLSIDLIKVKGRLGFRFPPRYQGARTIARFSSVVVRFVHPEAA